MSGRTNPPSTRSRSWTRTSKKRPPRSEVTRQPVRLDSLALCAGPRAVSDVDQNPIEAARDACRLSA